MAVECRKKVGGDGGGGRSTGERIKLSELAVCSAAVVTRDMFGETGDSGVRGNILYVSRETVVTASLGFGGEGATVARFCFALGVEWNLLLKQGWPPSRSRGAGMANKAMEAGGVSWCWPAPEKKKRAMKPGRRGYTYTILDNI